MQGKLPGFFAVSCLLLSHLRASLAEQGRLDLGSANRGLQCYVCDGAVPLQVRRGILSEESGALMKAFFQRRRAENNSKAAETDIVM